MIVLIVYSPCLVIHYVLVTDRPHCLFAMSGDPSTSAGDWSFSSFTYEMLVTDCPQCLSTVSAIRIVLVNDCPPFMSGVPATNASD